MPTVGAAVRNPLMERAQKCSGAPLITPDSLPVSVEFEREIFEDFCVVCEKLHVFVNDSPRDELDGWVLGVCHGVVTQHACVVVHVRHTRLNPRVVRVASVARLTTVKHLCH